jgi:hypothetical protein
MGIFPTSWKDAIVTAIFKKLNRQLTENYRPVSLLCCISKVFERLIYNNTYKHLLDNNLLDDENSGFCKNDSAILKLLALTDTIYKGLDDHDELLLVFLDISKAFDKVWHQGLLFKLEQVGIGGTLLEWFSSYLDNRKQRVVVNGQSSDLKHLHAGVPQGSILGPLLWLIYVSDMTDNTKCKAGKFADDIMFTKQITEHLDTAVEIVNCDLESTLDWSEQWRATFSASKACFLRASKKVTKEPLDPIVMDNYIIPEVDSHSNLGLTISNDMRWNEHVEKNINKAAKRLYQLRRLQYRLPRSSLVTIYLTMIRPILEYGDIIYDNMPAYLSQKLENVQRRAALICTGAYRHTEHTILLKDLGWDLLSTRRYQKRLTVYYTLLKGPTPNHILSHMPKTVSETTSHNLRNKGNLRPPKTRLQCSLNSFFPKTTRDWNNLSPQSLNILLKEQLVQIL